MIIANSIPKSGTHLLVSLLERLGKTDSHSHLSGSLVRDHVWWKSAYKTIIKSLPGDKVRVDLDTDNRYPIHLIDYNLRKKSNEYFCEAHLPYSETMNRIILSHSAKMIYIVRDPRDIILSYINHMERDDDYPLHGLFKQASNISEKIKLVLDGESYNGSKWLSPIKQRIDRSVGWADCDSAILVKFEELIGSKGGGDDTKQISAVQRIMDFIGAEGVAEEVASKIFDKNSETFNKGQAGRWIREIPGSDIDYIDLIIGDSIRRLGYEAV
ncbi:MAG: sulfotransferase domain-containing protein [Motiliproteus sp.]